MPSPKIFSPPNFSLNEGVAFSERLRSDQAGFARLADFFHRISGVYMAPSEKNYSLVASRLAPIMRARELATYDSYLQLIRNGTEDVRKEFISALTTHTTEFFRESVHFDCFRESIVALASKRLKQCQPEIRIWCSVCSTGQEAYSLAISALEAIGDRSGCTLKILASDIDIRMVETAARGIYSEHDVEKIPELLLQKYFLKQVISEAKFAVSPALKRIITFAPFNLVTPSYPFKYKFDFVFCRNVLIYFDPQSITETLNKLVQALGPEGLLFLGHSESGLLKHPDAVPIASAVYRKKA